MPSFYRCFAISLFARHIPFESAQILSALSDRHSGVFRLKIRRPIFIFFLLFGCARFALFFHHSFSWSFHSFWCVLCVVHVHRLIYEHNSNTYGFFFCSYHVFHFTFVCERARKRLSNRVGKANNQLQTVAS